MSWLKGSLLSITTNIYSSVTGCPVTCNPHNSFTTELYFFNLLIFLYNRFLLVIHFIHISVYMPIPISQFIPTPTPPLSPLGVHTCVLYICVSISALQAGSSCRDVDGPRDCHTEWSKLEREKQISYINAYMWKLEKWHRWTGALFLSPLYRWAQQGWTRPRNVPTRNGVQSQVSGL